MKTAIVLLQLKRYIWGGGGGSKETKFPSSRIFYTGTHSCLKDGAIWGRDIRLHLQTPREITVLRHTLLLQLM
jgi:hypothetical protein